jgi:hypothetical protein
MTVRILRPAETPWGDYGDILMHGMTVRLDRDDGMLQLERTGPYMPPITFPGIGDIVVTDAFKVQLLAAGFKGLSFRPVRKARVVELNWESWDRNSEPLEYPESGEPEDYVLARSHSPQTAASLGDLWELVLPVVAGIKRVPSGGRQADVRIVVSLDAWSGEQLFRADGVLYNYVSDSGQEWLAGHVGEHVSFETCDVA